MHRHHIKKITAYWLLLSIFFSYICQYAVCVNAVSQGEKSIQTTKVKEWEFISLPVPQIGYQIYQAWFLDETTILISYLNEKGSFYLSIYDLKSMLIRQQKEMPEIHMITDCLITKQGIILFEDYGEKQFFILDEKLNITFSSKEEKLQYDSIVFSSDGSNAYYYIRKTGELYQYVVGQKVEKVLFHGLKESDEIDLTQISQSQDVILARYFRTAWDYGTVRFDVLCHKIDFFSLLTEDVFVSQNLYYIMTYERQPKGNMQLLLDWEWNEQKNRKIFYFQNAEETGQFTLDGLNHTVYSINRVTGISTNPSFSTQVVAFEINQYDLWSGELLQKEQISCSQLQQAIGLEPDQWLKQYGYPNSEAYLNQTLYFPYPFSIQINPIGTKALITFYYGYTTYLLIWNIM